MKISLNKIRELNDEIGLGEYGFKSALRYQIALNYADDLCVESKKVCEIGPGGVIVYIAKYSDADVSAVVSPRENNWVDIFQKYNINSFEWDLNEFLDNKELHNSFDCIIFLETLEHLNRWPEQVLDDIRLLLKPEGFLILSTPNLVRVSNRIRMALGKPPNNPFKYSLAGEHHVREYTLSELKNFMPAEKWEIEESSYALPHSFGTSKYFKPILFLFRKLIATVIFIKATKKQ